MGFWLILVAALATAAPQGVHVEAQLERAATAIDAARYQDALAMVDQALAGQAVDDNERDWASYLKARALVGLGRGDAAEAAVRERYKAKPGPYAWGSIVSILAVQGRFRDAAAEIMELDDKALRFVNSLRPRTIDDIVTALDRDGESEVCDQLVTRLVLNKYTGPTAARVPDSLRLRYAVVLLKQSRTEDAARETESLESPALLTVLLADRTFAALWDHPAVAGLLQGNSLIARVERGVQARLEQQAMSSADWLETMRALRAIGRPREAVRLGLHAIDEARRESRSSGPALRLELAYAYAEMGQAWAARRTARELLREEGGDVATRAGVSQVLDVAGDDEGAYDLAASIGPEAGNPTIRAIALGVVACAAHDLGREVRVEEALGKLAELRGAAPAPQFEALVCTGHVSQAATALADMLKTPATRPQAILIAQLYADPANPTTDLRDMRYRLRALMASDAVQAAIKPYARTLALPFAKSTARMN